MMTDPIADMLTRIRNAYMAKKHNVLIPFSKVKLAIAEILVQEGYLNKAKKVDNAGKPYLDIELKYEGKIPAIQFLKRESKPGHRQYRKASELPKVLNGYGVAIISTSKGIMTAREARKLGIGGELICSVY